MKIYIKSTLINIKLLRNLKSKYEVHFNETNDIHLILDGSVITFIDKFGEYYDIDCSHWIDKILNEEFNDINFGDVVDQIINNVSNLKFKL